MRNRIAIVAWLILAAVAVMTSCAQPEDTGPEATDRPNILIVLLDDTGFADFGSYGSEISTPNIDNLAKTGMQFSNFHAAAACTPTR